MIDRCGTLFTLHHIKTVTQSNIQVHLIIIGYDNSNDTKIQEAKTNRITNNPKEDTLIDIVMNGHLKNCVCEKCHQAREMLKALRNM